MPKLDFKKILPIIIGLVIIAAIVGGIIFIRTILGIAGPPSGDEQRLEALRNDPMYSVTYPNATELRRAERGSRGFHNGTEDPPTVTYFAGTNDEDSKIIKFFIDKAVGAGWEIYIGPEKLSTADKQTVIFKKEQGGIGSLFIRLYDTERLNRLLLGEKLPADEYSTVIHFTLESELKEPPWNK